MRTFAGLAMVAALGGARAQCNSLSQDVQCMYNNDIIANMGSYNSLIGQTAYCKLQSFDTNSRKTSGGPSVFTSGRVRVGVGLAHAQFGSQHGPSWLDLTEGAATCGMCIEVLKAENVPELSDDLTTWDYRHNITVPFVAMVFDQCNDPICDNQGYLDFDIYNPEQPVAKGNPKILQWRAIDCPVSSADKLEYLFCTIGTCNRQDPENVAVWGDVWHPDWFAIMVRNQRIPVIQVELMDPKTRKYRKLEFVSGLGWLWDQYAFDVKSTDSFHLRVTSADGQVVEDIIAKEDVVDGRGEPGYRGGLLIHGTQQFKPSVF